MAELDKLKYDLARLAKYGNVRSLDSPFTYFKLKTRCMAKNLGSQ